MIFNINNCKSLRRINCISYIFIVCCCSVPFVSFTRSQMQVFKKKKDFVTHSLKSLSPLPCFTYQYLVISQNTADERNKVELCTFQSWKISQSLPSSISSFNTKRTIACHVDQSIKFAKFIACIPRYPASRPAYLVLILCLLRSVLLENLPTFLTPLSFISY